MKSTDRNPRNALSLTLAIPLLSGLLTLQDAGGLFEKPIRLEDEGGVIDVEIGHAAPFVADIDKDGKPDLLVGQFGSGRLRIYKNVADDEDGEEPRFAGFQWLMAEKEISSVPTG